MRKLLLSCVAVLGTVGMTALPTTALAVNAPVPMEYWAAPDFMRNVSVSPDGKYVAFIKATSQKGENIIEVFETADLSKKPYRVGAKKMRLRGFQWISDEEMIVNFDQQVSKRIKGFNQGAFQSKIALFSMDNEKFKELSDDDFVLSVTNPLVHDPDHVLMRYAFFDRSKSRRAPSFYKYNVKRGTKSLVLKGNEDIGGLRFDEYGNPRFARKFDMGSQEYVYLYRGPEDKDWKEYFRQHEDDFDLFQYGGLVEGDDSRIYVLANNGHDKVGLWKFNLQTKSFENLVYRRNDVDLVRTLRPANGWENPSKVTGVNYYKETLHRKFFDPAEEAMVNQFKAALPNAGYVTIGSMSRDGKTMIVRNISPRDPGTYYLYRDGKVSKLGGDNPLLAPEDLADVEYIEYTSRDGKKISGYLTVPNGPGPHPLIVMPHGGPFINEIVIHDDWAQMLANNGYMVLQPQYRGSKGYGLEFYKAGFINGGEGGKKMQDDKDDGVKHLIAQGKVDPDRVAMFGWSYGGYAALIAAARTPNIYQCVIAGAAVADNNQQVNYYRDRIDGAARIEQVPFWDGSISPIEEVSKVNVPMLVIHGSVDQRVPPLHAKKYVDELEKYGKNFEYVELKDADHFSNTLFYDHKMAAYPKMMDFLKNDCGPGGL
ncbi:alpha/beta hydrolase family protein [Fretibacter rubidus]|uniref:alpha/beta hydrolase family protein n=1 Tax=Fretibacter rubidus TaxID=570162 RepID=UPI00352A1ACF